MNLGVHARTAVVTGSTAGIGLAIATALVAEGASVVVNGRTQARVTAAIEQIRQTVEGAQVRGWRRTWGQRAAWRHSCARCPRRTCS